jgi:hypothetical protein
MSTPRRWTSGRVSIRRVLPDLDLQCKLVGLPLPEKEYRFDPERKWRIDYCWPDQKLAVEIEGGIYGTGQPCPVCKRRSVGAHTSIERLKSDLEKYDELAIAGFWLLRFMPEDVEQGRAIAVIRRWFQERGGR